MDHSFIYLIHILFVAPLLMYSGYVGNILGAKCKDNTYEVVFQLLFVVGLVVLLYHGHKYLKYKEIL
jgi:hypothetical protein